jgi:hypothetical protein
MKHLKYFENSTDVNASDYFEKIVDLMKHKNYDIKTLRIDGDKVYAGDKEITVGGTGGVMIHFNKTVCKALGMIQLNPSIGPDGEMRNFIETNFVYKDGSDIRYGDSVVDDEYLAMVDGFLGKEVIVEDQDEFTHYVTPDRIKKEVRRDPPQKPEWM